MFLINSKKLKAFISSFDFYSIKKKEFIEGIDSIIWDSIEEEIEILIIKAFFDKEIFHDYVNAKRLNELIIHKCFENDFSYFKLIGLLAYFELCIQLDTSESKIDFNDIIAEIQRLLKLEDLKNLGLLEKEIQFNIILSSYELFNGNYKKALSHISDSFSIHLKFLMNAQSKTYFEVLLLNVRAYLNFNLGSYQDAILYMVRCLSLAKDLPVDLQEEVNLTILNNQCLIYRTIGEYELAQDFSQQLEDELPLHESKLFNPFELSNIYNNIGLFEAEQGNYSKSLDLLNKALEIHQDVTNSLQEQAISLGNIARILGDSGDFLKAGETFKTCLEMYDKSGSHKELVEKICWYIDFLLQENNLILSAEYIKMAEYYTLQHDSNREKILVDIRKAKHLMSSGNIFDAKSSFILIRSIADTYSHHRESIQCSLYLAELSLLSKDITDLKEGLKACERVLVQSAQTSHFIYQIRSLITKAEINGLLLEFNSSLYAIDDAFAIAEEKNLTYFKKELTKVKHDLIEKRKLLTASVLDTSTISKEILIKYIRLTTGKKLQLTDELVHKLEPYYLSVFLFENTELNIIYDEEIDKEFQMQPSTDPLTMGLLFSASIGQGNRYNEGLFVLPTPDYNQFNSIVFSKVLSENKSYLLMAFSYHKELESLYYNRMEIEKFLNRMLGPVMRRELLSKDFLKELKNGFNEFILREVNLIVSQ